MNTEQSRDALQKITDSEFDRIFDSPWYKFPAELVREELIRRLKLREDLSIDAKRIKYKEIIDRFKTVGDVAAWEQFQNEIANMDEGFNASFLLAMESSKTRTEEMNEHYRQLRELHSLREDPFEGKTKPGDWRPEGTELCPACGGCGKGAGGRMCGKCSGRGFIRRRA